jgi:hypothetical protein
LDCCSTLSPETLPLDIVLLAGTGLAISLGHCIGMCGPLVGVYSLRQRALGITGWRLLPQLLLYHAGRLLGYASIGFALGLLGSATLLTTDGKAAQGALSCVLGLFMLLLGCGLAGWLPTRRWVESGFLQRFVARRMGGLLDADTPGRRFTLGVGNGFLPCGPVYMVALTAAAAGNGWRGALAMLAFGVGTLPVLLVLGLGVGQLAGRARRFFNGLGVALVLVLACQLILRGLAAWNLVPHLRFGEFVIW